MTHLRRLIDALLASLLLTAAGVVAATPQTIYRCGPDGRVLSQTPCRDTADVKKPDPKASEPKRDAAGKPAREPAKEPAKGTSKEVAKPKP